MMRRDAYDRFHAPENVDWDQGAFRSGVMARERGDLISENPYVRAKGTPGYWLHDSWNAGYTDADMCIQAEIYNDGRGYES